MKKETGQLTPGESVNVTCNSGYLKQAGSAAFFPTCGADSSFLVMCQDSACGFEPSPPTCRPIGCHGLSSQHMATNDSLYNLTFRYDGIAYPAANMSQGGLVRGGGDAQLEVHCPPGYRVHDDMDPPYPLASQEKSKIVGCPIATCELPVVRCVRLTCVSTTLPEDATGTRLDTLKAGSTVESLGSGANITHLLYGETVTAACGASYRLPSAAACSNAGQGFSYSCDDVDRAGEVPDTFNNTLYDDNYTSSLYVGATGIAFFSATPPHQLQCEPITCDVNTATVNSETATTSPANGGVVQSGKTVNVSCLAGDEGDVLKYLVRGANSTRHPVS